MDNAIASGGCAWVACDEGQFIGYASVVPLPGLPAIVDLQVYVASAWRRRGVGSQLLKTVVNDIRQRGVRQIAHEVHAQEGTSAAFLRAHGFYLEHVEREMALEIGENLPDVAVPTGCHLQTRAREEAIALFRQLYEESFAGMPWYQPYSYGEVAIELQDARDMLFLTCNDDVLGFVWVHRLEVHEAEIEPIGIRRASQGEGWGQTLLGMALARLASQGIQHVRLTVWESNAAATRLYRHFGFHITGYRYYLAYDLL